MHNGRGVLRYQKVSSELGKGLKEEYSTISKNWGCDGVEIGFGGRLVR